MNSNIERTMEDYKKVPVKVTEMHEQSAESFQEELVHAFEAVRMMIDRVKYDGRIIFANYEEIIEKFGPLILVAARKFSEE